MSILPLQPLGITDTESSLYELLLRLGEVPVADIIRESGLKRPTVYKALYSLEKKGLVSSQDIKKKIHFKPESPAQLADQIESTYAEAVRARNTISQIIPQLLSAYTFSTERPVVQLYEGIEGIKKIFLDTIEEKAEIYAVLQTADVELDFQKWLDNVYGVKRVKANIHAKVIVASGSWSQEYRSKDNDYLRTTTLVPSEKFPFKHEVNIYGNKVAFMNYRKGEKMIGIIINNAIIAQTMKAWFDLAWEGAKKYSTTPH